MDSIKSKTITGFLWSFVESAGVQLMRFLFGIILARLLFPEQFGLIGMLSIFMAVAQSILDSGFGAALVQKENASRIDFSTIFFFQIAIGLLIYTIIYFVAPWISSFYNQPLLTSLSRVLSLIFIINSLGWVHGTILSKNINFNSLAYINLFSSFFSGIFGVVLAILGYGVWSLVAQQLINSLCITILFWFFSPWRPVFVFSLTSLKGLFKYGSRIFISGILNQLFENIYYLISGKLFSIRELGFFSRAKTFADIPSSSISSIIGRVAFPIFSIIQSDRSKLLYGLKKIYTTIGLVHFSLIISLSVMSNNLVLVLLSDKWADSITFLKLLFLCGLFTPLHIISMDVIRAVGNSGLYLKIEIIKKVLIVINIIITYRWGLNSVIIGMIIISCLSFFISSYYIKVIINFPIQEQITIILPFLMIAILTASTVYFVGKFSIHNIGILVFQFISGFLFWFFFCTLFNIPAFKELREMVLSKLDLRSSLEI